MRLFVLCVCLAGMSLSLSPSSSLTPGDRLRLSTLFKAGLGDTADLATLHYSIMGSLLLGETIQDTKGLCSQLSSHSGSPQLESLYLASRAAASLSCPLSLTGEAPALVSGGLTDPAATTSSIFYSAHTLASTGAKLDSAAVSKALAAALKKDDSLLSLGLAFHTASLLAPGTDLSKFTERLEDAVVQADEVDGRMLQFEGGLSVTSVLLTGAAKLALKAKQLLPVTGEQTVKFANYLMSRKSVQQSKGAYHLLEATLTLASNPQHVPIVLTLASSNSVSKEDPFVVLEVTDLAGGSVPDMTVTLETATRQEDESVVAASQAFTHLVSTSKYSLDLLSSAAGAQQGFYTLVVTAQPKKADKRFVGNKDVSITLKVLTTVSVAEASLKVTDVDGSTEGRTFPLTYPDTKPGLLTVDPKEVLQLSFSVQNDAGKALLVHQAFVKLTHVASGAEIIYVAEPDKVDDIYTFSLDLAAAAPELNSKSGEYSVTLILGDATISNPVLWEAARLSITFPGEAGEAAGEGSLYVAKPEIRHLFRQPEARPPGLVSSSFTLLCLSPLLILLILWAKLGVNISNFQFSVASLGFHLGLGAIFILYFYFWLQLNMFTTVKYLSVLGLGTFLAGNSLLASIAKRNKSA